MGSLEEDILEVNTAPTNLREVVKDLDVEDDEVGEIKRPRMCVEKVQRFINDYKVKILNELRPGKNLLVLDLDNTLCDAKLMRPYLHEFLTSAYAHYDIVIWSATYRYMIDMRMNEMGVSSHASYKIAFYLDSKVMIRVQEDSFKVKPLSVIWGKFEQFGPKNTIMIDDKPRNFNMNPKNGLAIRPFRQVHLNTDADNELLKLSKYLRDLAEHCDDFSAVNHEHWERYEPERRHNPS